MIAATILAAGSSSRMGHPKALLKYRGKTFLQAILEATEVLGARRFVVVGESPENILKRHDLRDVTVLSNEEMRAGPIGSIRASVQAVINHPVDGLLVWPVDFPHVAVETARALLDRFRETGSPVVVPRFADRRGHPVVFGRAVFGELLAAPEDEGARAVVRADASRVQEVLVNDPAVVDQLNTPEAYEDLIRREDQYRR